MSIFRAPIARGRTSPGASLLSRAAKPTLAVAVIAALFSAGTVPVAAAPAAALIASYDFSQTSGTSIPDTSGNAKTATIRGAGATVSGDTLNLPGGAANSGAGYVQLPTGLFDAKDTVSVSLWLKNETAAGNYAAMFFGTTQNLPAQYWLLNPANLDGRLKNVVTNGSSPASPWTTESGISPTIASRGSLGPVTNSEWSMHTTVITPTSITAYLDGVKVATVPTTRTVSQFGSNLVAYIGRSSYADKFFEGGVRDVSIYGGALTDAEVEGLFSENALTDEEAVDLDSQALSIPGADDIRGNITLAAAGKTGTDISWTTSDSDVVSADGKVIRPANGSDPVDVTLTATVSKGTASAVRSTVVKVQPKPESEDFEGYFFPYFTGESSTTDEEVYFATSNGNDPQSWLALNNGKSVLQSDLGERGIRDPFIIRSPEGDRFYLLATDLNMADQYGGSNFGEAQESGSKNLVVWESNDLVNWSDQRIIKVSSDLAGNTWAPEATWDEESGQYIVYWASNLYANSDVGSRNFSTSYNRQMFVTTRDFVTFSQPKPWVDVKRGNGRGMIDSNVVTDGDTFYRFIKDEASFDVRQEKSTELDAVVTATLPTTSSTPGWQLVKEHIGVGEPNPWGGTFTQGEGPSAFRDNKDPDHWYLLIDQPTYHGGQGYMLFETNDIGSGDWTSVPAAELPGDARHGTVLPITKAEQARLLTKYPSDAESAYTISVDDEKTGPTIKDTMYGLFFEDINWAADGGLYAELVRNRSFEFLPIDNASYTGMTGWRAITSGGGAGTMATVNNDQRLNGKNRTYLDINLTNPTGGTYGVENAGYNNGVSVKDAGKYDFSIFARTTAPAGTPLTVSLRTTGGEAASDSLSLVVDGDGWIRYSGTLTASRTTDAARLAVQAGGTGNLRLDMVSLFPQDTYKGRENGLRKDLGEKLEALNPGFLRFPGGCIVNVNSHEGYDEASNFERARSYQWKDSVGPVEERATNSNFWGYNQTLGLGYFEYFQLSEDLGALPVPDVPALLNGCGQGVRPATPALVQRHIQDTLDLIEFANGSVTSEWGKLRADMGHPAPFNLERMEIGNEENFPVEFMANFVQFRDAIKAAYPEMILISNSGPDDEGAVFDRHWEQNRAEKVDIVDEHYYNSPTWFLQNNKRYDSYDRNGPKVWIGEYASQNNTLYNGLSEAAYMTGIERNADVVEMASYAPLFANVDNVQWTPDMIWFDNDESWGSASYEVQKLFMNNVGDRVVPTESTGDVIEASPITGSVGLSTWATAARYDDVKVTAPGGAILFEDDFNDLNAEGWETLAPGGNWSAAGGNYSQSSTTAQNTLVAGPALDATDYDLSLKATKVAGAEGFLVGFGVKDSANYYWWNLGGFGNTRNLVEKATGGAKSTLFSQDEKRIETGRVYDIKVEVRGTKVKLYLDGVLQGSFADDKVVEPFAQVLTEDDATGDLILKVVNAQDTPASTAVDLGGITVGSSAEMTVLAGKPGAVNSRTATPVKPVTSTITDVSSKFTRTFAPNSVTFIRMTAGAPDDTTAPVIDTTVSPSAPNGSDGWYTSNVDVTATATDDSGDVPTVQVSRDGALSWEEYTAPAQLTEKASSVAFRAIDPAGNTSATVTRSVKIDSTMPTSSATLDSTSRTATLSADDSGSGIATVEYKIGSAPDWVSAAGSKATVALGAAEATLNYRAVDVAGNVGATGSLTVPAAPVTVPPAPVTKAIARMAVTVKSAPHGKPSKVTVAVSSGTSPATGKVTVRALGKNYSATLAKGRATVSLSPTIRAGLIPLSVNYSGDSATLAGKTSALAVIEKATTRVSVSPKSSKPKVGKKHVVTIDVAGVKRPTGSLVISVGGKKVKTVALKSSSKGTMKVTLPALKKSGRVSIEVRYSGNASVKASKASAKVRAVR